jgi:uncharacterized protein (DUF4415 family)
MKSEDTYLKTKSGRLVRLNTEEEEAQIRAGIEADPDARELSDETLTHLRPIGRPKAEATKQPVSIRLSPEVVDYFRSTGKGWQTRIDQVLKDYVASR